MLTTKINFSTLLMDLKNNKIKLEDYIQEVCERIQKVDSIVHSLLPESNRYDRLIKEAKELEERFPNPSERPPLYGILVGVKDLFRVDGLPTTAGSLLPSSLFEGSEAESVTRLRNAGALILGKTVTTEFAYFEPGPTVNPNNVNHSPGGSSSGSAAGVMAGIFPLALGTQTMGSVNRPASFCGVVGFKPSMNRISTEGLIHFSKSMDQIGFFTQDMEGVELTASLLCTSWDQQKPNRSQPTIGVPEGPYLDQMSAKDLDKFESYVKKLSEAGYPIKRVPIFENIEQLKQLHKDVAMSELAKEHEDKFIQYEPLYRPRTIEGILAGRKVSNERADEAREFSIINRDHLHDVMEQQEIQLWVCPSSLGAAPTGINSTGDPGMNVPWTNAGMPTITLPVDRDPNGLPIGLQFVGAYMEDERLVHWSKDFEKVFLRSK